jgi:ribosomal protein L37AE/L43A
MARELDSAVAIFIFLFFFFFCVWRCGVASYRCPSCGSTNTYYRVRKGEYVCRRCGATWIARTVEPEVKKG